MVIINKIIDGKIFAEKDFIKVKIYDCYFMDSYVRGFGAFIHNSKICARTACFFKKIEQYGSTIKIGIKCNN
jgi:hypothetical protein